MDLTSRLMGATAYAPMASPTALNPMLRGPRIAYAPEGESEAAADPAGGAGPEPVAAEPDAGADDVADDDRIEISDEDPDAQPDDGAGEDKPDRPDDDTMEVEFNGAKHRVPKALNDAFMMRADYSQKTEAVAQERKAVAAERQDLSAQREQALALDQEVVSAHARAHALSEQVAAYKAVDWQSLQTSINAIEDHQERAQAQTELSAAFSQFTIAERALQTAQAEAKTKEDARLDSHRTAAQAAHDKAVENTLNVLKDPVNGIKGWGRQLAENLIAVAAEFGVTRETLAKDPSPEAWKILNEVKTLREENKALRATQKQKETVNRHALAQAAQPAVAVTPKAVTSTGPSDNQGTKAWMERRNAQLAKRA